jgi:hypothetical protein
MKKLFQQFLFLALGASFVFLYSCGEDEEPTPDAPTLSVSAVDGSGAAVSNGGSISATDTITFSFIASTPGGFNALRWSGDVTPDEVNRTGLGIEAGETAPDLPGLAIGTASSDAGSSASIQFILVDDESQTDTVTFEFDITDAPSPEARAYSATLLEVIAGDGSNAAFFSSTDGMTYSPEAVVGTNDPVSATIDFGYYYGSTDLASFGSPEWFSTSIFDTQVANWGTLNAITFVSTSLTEAQFNEVSTWADIDEIYSEGTVENQVITELAEGQVLAFETDADKDGGAKKGLILVKTISGTFNSNDSITIDVLVQEDAE